MTDYYRKFIFDLIKIITIEFKNQKDYFNDIIKKWTENPQFCDKDKNMTKYGIYFLIILYIITILWVIYDIIINVYKYALMTLFFYFKTNKRLIDSPLFQQIINLIYINDYLTIDMIFILLFITPFFILFKINIFEKINIETKDFFSNVIIFNYGIILLCIIYFASVYYNITNLGIKINIINKLVYNNINSDFIYSEKFCNYLNKKSLYDTAFMYGKCNDLKNNMSINRLYDYIKKITLEISQHVAPINNLSIDNFKLLKDKNGILYKDKIISALFTFQMIKYYVDNGLEKEALDFFSTFNLLYLKKINVLQTRINPVLYMRYGEIILFNDLYSYNDEMEISFGGNKDIYNYIYKEYISVQNNVQNLVVDVFNICSYKLISIYALYFIIFIFLIILIIIYFYNKLNK
jgi:hypothetical protein